MASTNPYEALLEQRRREQEAQAAILRKGGLTPEQMAALAEQAGYDGSDRQDMMADLLRNGQAALIGGEIPQGRQMGSVYAPPSWSEALNAAAQRALGGYQMGQARRESKKIDAKTASALEAKQSIANEELRQKQLAEIQKQQDAALRASYNTAAQDARSAASQAAQDRRAASSQAAQESRLSRTLAAKNGGAPKESPALQYQKEKDAAAKSSKDNEATRKLATQINSAGIPEARSGIETFYKTIRPFEVKDETGSPTGEYTDIPGLGGIQNIQGIVGNAATAGADLIDRISGKETDATGMDVKRAYTNVLNKKIKDMSGGQVTVNEWMRNLSAAGSTAWSEEMSAIEGMREIEKAMAAQESAIKAGYDPSIVESYDARVAPKQAPAVAAPKSAPPSGASERTIKRTGITKDGRRVIEYSDGTREYQ